MLPCMCVTATVVTNLTPSFLTLCVFVCVILLVQMFLGFIFNHLHFTPIFTAEKCKVKEFSTFRSCLKRHVVQDQQPSPRTDAAAFHKLDGTPTSRTCNYQVNWREQVRVVRVLTCCVFFFVCEINQFVIQSQFVQ
ncbi:hypothetical protein D4764_14G0009230 [Takifugu flavidus]|uniref:Uncharacterized protein n=1 Tax=Takifugu flavidus TaxID=433684 RepID=A0A5C6P9L5_9TELE|nr:hypothetical protein D4764_14G0009230 [Takifugu flavidus]